MLQNTNLSPKNYRAQTYNVAGNMTGQQKCCANIFQYHSPGAPYFHCASHNVDPALSETSSISEIQCMLDDIRNIAISIKYSPKRQLLVEKCIKRAKQQSVVYDYERRNHIKKLRLFSDTRRVERHTSLFDFKSVFADLLDCFEVI